MANDPLLTRRRLVQTGAALAATVSLGRLADPAFATQAPSHLRRSAYTPLTGAAFSAAADGGATATLRLTDVADLERARHDPAFAGRDDAFALLFSGPAGALGSGIHDLYTPSLGAFALFISPVQSSPSGEQRYEVVVDRSVRLAQAQADAPQPLAQSNAPAASTPTPPSAREPEAVAHAHAGTAAAQPPKSAGAPKPAKPGKLVQSALLARRGGELTVDVRVAAGRDLVSVRAELWRDGVERAHAARRLKGRAGLRLHLRELRATPAGAYELRIIVTDRHGKRTRTVRRATVS